MTSRVLSIKVKNVYRNIRKSCSNRDNPFAISYNILQYITISYHLLQSEHRCFCLLPSLYFKVLHLQSIFKASSKHLAQLKNFRIGLCGEPSFFFLSAPMGAKAGAEARACIGRIQNVPRMREVEGDWLNTAWCPQSGHSTIRRLYARLKRSRECPKEESATHQPALITLLPIV